MRMHGRAKFAVGEFQFADVPLHFSDLLTSKICEAPEEGASLYTLPDTDTLPVAKVYQGENLQVIQQDWNSGWMIVYYRGNYLFIQDVYVK